MKMIKGDLVLSKGESKILWALMKHGPMSAVDVSQLFPREERPTVGFVRCTLNELRKHGHTKRRGNARRCETVIYAMPWQKFEEKTRLNRNAYFSPFGGYHSHAVRRSMKKNG
jgi:hypothetical protein